MSADVQWEAMMHGKKPKKAICSYLYKSDLVGILGYGSWVPTGTRSSTRLGATRTQGCLTSPLLDRAAYESYAKAFVEGGLPPDGLTQGAPPGSGDLGMDTEENQRKKRDVAPRQFDYFARSVLW